MPVNHAIVKQVQGITFVAKGNSCHWVTMDGHEMFGGSNAASSPKELLLFALGGCTASDVVPILKKKRADVTSLEVRLTADGSAVMHVMGKGTPHEMVTMFHPDGKRLLATHYCAAHNQPRMALVPGKEANQVAFEFVDGTNIAAGDEHMKRVVITFVDADHHDERWTSSSSPTPAVDRAVEALEEIKYPASWATTARSRVSSTSGGGGGSWAWGRAAFTW